MRLYRLRRLERDDPASHAAHASGWHLSDVVEALDGGGELAAVSALGLEAAGEVVGDSPQPIILRTTTHRVDDGEDDAAASLSWMPRARTRFESAIRKLATRKGPFWLWPSANGVLSDVPSTQSFLRAHEGGPISLFFDPASLLTREMLPKAEDHLARSFSALAASASAILLANVEPGDGVEGVQIGPLTRGVLSPRLLVDLLAAHAGPQTPVVLVDGDLAGQRAVLGV